MIESKALNMKPLLAYNKVVQPQDVKYPCVASIKMDGYRCLIVDGKAVSRNLKPIANNYVREKLEALNLPSLDGELILTDTKNFNSVQSAFSSHSGKPNFKYVVFDDFSKPNLPYTMRFAEVAQYLRFNNCDGIVTLAFNETVTNEQDLQDLYDYALSKGEEGLIIRDPDGPYKYGRSTLNQGIMLKMKPVEDAEARVIRFEELMHNGDAGNSKKLENLFGGDKLGALVCETEDGVQFKLGSGFDDEQRKEIWYNQSKYLGKLATYKYQNLTPAGKPRFPVFKGFRHSGDM